MIWTNVFAFIFLFMLGYGVRIRYRLMNKGFCRLSWWDRLGEWAGYLFFIGLCMGAISLFYAHPRISTALIAGGITVLYNLTVSKQFPMFKGSPKKNHPGYDRVREQTRWLLWITVSMPVFAP